MVRRSGFCWWLAPDNHAIVANLARFAPRPPCRLKTSATTPQLSLCDVMRPREVFQGPARTFP